MFTVEPERDRGRQRNAECEMEGWCGLELCASYFCPEWWIVIGKAMPMAGLARKREHCFFLDLDLARDVMKLRSRHIVSS